MQCYTISSWDTNSKRRIAKSPVVGHNFSVELPQLDDRQITHLVCVRLRHLLYDFLGGVLGLLYKRNNRKEAQNNPQKSYSKCFRRTQIRRVIWRSSNSTISLENADVVCVETLKCPISCALHSNPTGKKSLPIPLPHVFTCMAYYHLKAQLT